MNLIERKQAIEQKIELMLKGTPHRKKNVFFGALPEKGEGERTLPEFFGPLPPCNCPIYLT